MAQGVRQEIILITLIAPAPAAAMKVDEHRRRPGRLGSVKIQHLPLMRTVGHVRRRRLNGSRLLLRRSCFSPDKPWSADEEDQGETGSFGRDGFHEMDDFLILRAADWAIARPIKIPSAATSKTPACRRTHGSTE